MATRWQDRHTRRDVLRMGAVGAAAVAAGGLRLLGAAEETKRKIPVALQLYSVRNECDKDKGKNLAKVVQAVAKMGYEGVEFAGYYGWGAKDLRKLLDDNGLKCCGTHTGFGSVLGGALKGTVEFHQTLGNKFLIVPGLGRKETESIEAWTATAKKFNEVAEKLKPLGMHVGYHNHSSEFKAMDGQVPWDAFFGNTVKEVVMQLDIGNAMGGGADVVAILKKYPGRALTLHIKEHGGGPKTVVGEGDAKWKEIIPLAQTTGGTQWYIIEHERGGQPPMEAVEKCLVNFRKMVAEMGY